MGARPEKCMLYPGGIDNEVFLRFAAEDTSDFLKRHNIRPDAHIVSYLGTIEERKNPLVVLKIAQTLLDRPDIHFILAGRSDSDYSREVVEFAQKLPNVSYLGEIDEREKMLLIRASYLNILMSKLEALGISQQEFMYGGVPVITSGVGGQSWLVQNGVEGLHTGGPEDIPGAVDAIISLIEDKNLYCQMSINAKEKVSKFASIHLNSELNSAIDRELAKESGLTEIPLEMQDTLTRPEYVLKSWSSGASGIVATNRRIFIKRGLISKSVLGMHYENVKAIEHIKNYPWQFPVSGAVLTCLAYFAPHWQNLFSADFLNRVKTQMDNFLGIFPPHLISNPWLVMLVPLLPFLISLGIFFVQTRAGFQLYGEGTKPVFMPGRFRKAIEFIRNVQDDRINRELEDKSPETGWRI